MKRRRNDGGQSDDDGDSSVTQQSLYRHKKVSSRMKILIGVAILVVAALLLSFGIISYSGFFFPPDETLLLTLASRRFPKYDTPEFKQLCNWTVVSKQEDDCTFLLRVYPRETEGVAQWLSRAASGYLYARQTGCRLLMDYGDNVDIHQVLQPAVLDWTIPKGFECSGRCANVTVIHTTPDRQLRKMGQLVGKKVARVPYYRQAYVTTPYHYPTVFQELEQTVPGFTVESGMACSLGNLFDLSPSAAQFEPDLFTKILLSLRDKKALVIAVYIRSGYADDPRFQGVAPMQIDTSSLYRQKAMPCIQCALSLEEKYLSLSKVAGLSRVVWMLVTDSAYLKQWISESYGVQISVKPQANIIPREIITTTSRGIHTKSALLPSTADVAEAMIDWYFIGESDLVVISSRQHSFAATASLRTNRPLYEAGNCLELPRFAPPNRIGPSR